MSKNYPAPPPELVEYYYRLRRPNESVRNNIKRAALHYSAAHPHMAGVSWWKSVLGSHLSEVGHTMAKEKKNTTPLSLFN